MKIFFDFEFTGLHQHTTPISLGCVAENGKQFYCEFTDYDLSQVDDWIQENVIDKLYLEEKVYTIAETMKASILDDLVEMRETKKTIGMYFKLWLEQFATVEFWSDCLAYDWVLMNDIIADYKNGYPELPNNVYYIPFDLATLFKVEAIDPDINREEFAQLENNEQKHNSLWDAIVIKGCYDKIESDKTDKVIEQCKKLCREIDIKYGFK